MGNDSESRAGPKQRKDPKRWLTARTSWQMQEGGRKQRRNRTAPMGVGIAELLHRPWGGRGTVLLRHVPGNMVPMWHAYMHMVGWYRQRGAGADYFAQHKGGGSMLAEPLKQRKGGQPGAAWFGPGTESGHASVRWVYHVASLNANRACFGHVHCRSVYVSAFYFPKFVCLFG